MKPSTTKPLAAAAGMLLWLLASTGIASAAPDPSAIVNSTCTYPQVMAALRAQSPATADQISSDPVANGWLQGLVAAPPEQRRQMITQAEGWPQVQQNMPLIFQVANTCNNY